MTPSFSTSFQNVFRAHENEKQAFSNSSGFKSVLKELRFCFGLEWTVGLTLEIKLRFQASPEKCGRAYISVGKSKL